MYALSNLWGMRKPKAPKLRQALADNLRSERARRRWTQEELAEHAGISRVYVGSIEQAKFSCSLDVLEQLAAGLKVDPRDLLAPG